MKHICRLLFVLILLIVTSFAQNRVFASITVGLETHWWTGDPSFSGVIHSTAAPCLPPDIRPLPEDPSLPTDPGNPLLIDMAGFFDFNAPSESRPLGMPLGSTSWGDTTTGDTTQVPTPFTCFSMYAYVYADGVSEYLSPSSTFTFTMQLDGDLRNATGHIPSVISDHDGDIGSKTYFGFYLDKLTLPSDCPGYPYNPDPVSGNARWSGGYDFGHALGSPGHNAAHPIYFNDTGSPATATQQKLGAKYSLYQSLEIPFADETGRPIQPGTYTANMTVTLTYIY